MTTILGVYMTHHYEVYHVSDKEYENHSIGERFKGGTVINGISGVNDEALLVTVVAGKGTYVDGDGISYTIIAAVARHKLFNQGVI